MYAHHVLYDFRTNPHCMGRNPSGTCSTVVKPTILDACNDDIVSSSIADEGVRDDDIVSSVTEESKDRSSKWSMDRPK